MEVSLSSTSPEVAQDSERQSGQKTKIHKKLKIIPSSESFLKEILSLSYTFVVVRGFWAEKRIKLAVATLVPSLYFSDLKLGKLTFDNSNTD